MICGVCGEEYHEDDTLVCPNLDDKIHVSYMMDLIEAQEQLLVCYRMRTHPTDELLDRVVSLKEALNI